MKKLNTIRSRGSITFIVLIVVLSVFTVTVYADGNGAGDKPVKPGVMTQETSVKRGGATDKPYYDPDLESILAVKDRSDYAFLSRLTPQEQRELYRIFKKRLDDESGVVVSIMAVVSGFVPAFISAQFAGRMEPAVVARISDKVSVKKAIAIGKRLDPEFMAEVAVYQDPKKVTAVVEGLPEENLVEITRVLFQKGEYRVVAGFSDYLSVEKLRRVSEKINDPSTLIEIARYMENKDKIVKTAVALSDDYLLGFIDLLSTEDDYELAAAVGRELDVKRQINMLNRLEPEKAARLAAHYSPETIRLILKNTDDRQLGDMTRRLLMHREKSGE